MKQLFASVLFIICVAGSLSASNLVVLQYHHVDNSTPASTSISPEQFEQHLAYLEKNNFKVVPLESALNKLTEHKSLPDKAIAITFDDAYTSIYHKALPLLKKRKWPFTLFVATKPVDEGLRDYLSWEELRIISENGGAIGLHSHSHPYLVRKRYQLSFENWQQWARSEILTSSDRVKEELGITSRLFAYPYGESDLELEKMVKELKLFGFGQQSGVVWEGSDFQLLPRFPVSGDYAVIKDFSIKVKSLALPVVAIDPMEPVLFQKNDKPALHLKLAPGDYIVDQLQCYATGQGSIKINWVDREQLVFSVVPNKPLPFGRSKYNCTAPQSGSDRYYWFSRQWLRLDR